MKKSVFLALLSVIFILLSCARDENSLVIVCEGKTLVYRELNDIPLTIEVKGPCDVYSGKYPITIHFPDPDNPAVFDQNSDFFREGSKARLNGTTNKSRIYQIWFHSNEIRGAEYLNPVFYSITIKLLK